MPGSTSPTWSVYESAWPLASGHTTASPPVPYVDGPPDALSLKGCGLVKEALLQHGAQGAVYAAHADQASTDLPSLPRRYAVKRLFSQSNDFGRRGVEETVLREATLLRYANHRSQQQQQQQQQQAHCARDQRSPFVFGQDDSVNVIPLYRVVEAPHGEMCLVMELCATDMRRLTMERVASSGVLLGLNRTAPSRGSDSLSNPSVLRYLLRRMLAMVHFLHTSCGMLHRDIKLSNFLVLPGGELRLTDFGSARFLCHSSTEPTRDMNAQPHPSVSYSPASTRTTMLYQPPETLMGSQTYGTALDVWGLGVVFAELILQKHLFSADGELGLLSAIWKLLGSPARDTPQVDAAKPTFDLKFSTNVVPAEAADLLRRMLTLVPEQRITAAEALQHPFLVFDGAQSDDAEGARLWREKVTLSLQKREESVKVCMPSLSLGLHDDDDDDSADEGNNGVPRLPKLTPPNFTLQLF